MCSMIVLNVIDPYKSLKGLPHKGGSPIVDSVIVDILRQWQFPTQPHEERIIAKQERREVITVLPLRFTFQWDPNKLYFANVG